MNTLNLTVGGRTFAIACQPGDEPHIQNLGAQIDAKFQQLAPRYSQNLLFATLQLADDLHRAQLTAEKAAADLAATDTHVANAKREADLAVSQAEKLKVRVADLERELDRLQSANQQEANKYNDLAADNERFKIAVMEADAEKSRLDAELATAKRERDTFEQRLAELPASSERQSFPNPTAAMTDPDLAPSLERFAELLENCVAKLETSSTPS
ncbi:cell division protein ZapA [Parerythrobacter aestuarii]|uniref:cell division protein ZapA n=1 Tax=Parerythrobacter aestuarii TaxID=3020909 RepID=UPI0024DE95CD|nr:cell division protein ZapA [Parerythrobacter aestuarii]